MNIAICDDEQFFIDRVKGFINEPDAVVYEFNSGIMLLNSDVKFDIVLLDIEIPDMSGLKIAEELAKKDNKSLLLFITSHGEYSTRGYEFRAFRYILKSEPDEFVKRNIQDAIDEYRNNHFYLTVTYKREIARILSTQILYVESFGHTVIVHTKDRECKGQDKFKDIYQALKSHGFLQCHKSYIVNMRYIKSIEKNLCVNLDNDIKIPIGRKYGASTVDTYLKFEDRRI